MTTKTKEIKIGSTISENEHYTLAVCELPEVSLPCYGVVNKRYGVVEMSTSVLANARKFLGMLNKWEMEPQEDIERDLPDFSPDLGSFQ